MSTRWCARSWLPPRLPSSDPTCTSTYRMPRESASLSTTALSPVSASTASVSSYADSHRASWKPVSINTPTASSSCGFVVPPTMTRVTAGDLVERFGAQVVQMLGAAEHRSARIRGCASEERIPLGSPCRRHGRRWAAWAPKIRRRLPAGTLTSQRLFQALGETFRHAERNDVLDGRFANRLHRAEVSQEGSLARGTDALDRVQRRCQRLSCPHFAVVGDREPVRLVANALDEKHPR